VCIVARRPNKIPANNISRINWIGMDYDRHELRVKRRLLH